VRVFIVRAPGRWWCRAVKVCDGEHGNVMTTNISAYSDVRCIRVGTREGALYQPLRAGDIIVKDPDNWTGAHYAPRPVVVLGTRQLASRIDIEPPIPFTPTTEEKPDVQ
jgi:hypothetical protein